MIIRHKALIRVSIIDIHNKCELCCLWNLVMDTHPFVADSTLEPTLCICQLYLSTAQCFKKLQSQEQWWAQQYRACGATEISHSFIFAANDLKTLSVV